LSNWPDYRKELNFESSIKIAKILLNIIEASRKLRTSLNLHQNHKIDKLLVKTLNNDYISILNSVNSDIKSAARAKRMIFSDEADFKTADDNLFIKIEK
jgi:valyl-tRNA synthetase